MLVLVADIGKNNEYMSEELRKRCLGLVTCKRREKVERIRNQGDKDRSLAAGILLNVATGMYEEHMTNASLGTNLIRHPIDYFVDRYDSTYDYEIVSGTNGKPEYKKGKDIPEIYFNLSHSGEFVVCAVSHKPIGVDIEGNRKVSLKTAKRFFTAAEYKWVCGNENSNKDEQLEATLSQQKRFFRIWTMKEAYSKFTGIGIANGISQAEFIPDEEGKLKPRSIHNEQNFSGINTWEYECDGYHIAVIGSELN